MRLALGAEEIFFVATPNAEKQYSFELDVADSAKDFGQLSGTYLLVSTMSIYSTVPRHLFVCNPPFLLPSRL